MLSPHILSQLFIFQNLEARSCHRLGKPQSSFESLWLSSSMLEARMMRTDVYIFNRNAKPGVQAGDLVADVAWKLGLVNLFVWLCG